MAKVVKRQATVMVLGASAPLVVSCILAERAGRKKAAIQARRLMANVAPQIDRLAAERARWKNDLLFVEILEWALQSPMLNPRPKS